MDFPVMLNHAKVAADFAQANGPFSIALRRLNALGINGRPRRGVPVVLDLDTLGTSPAWNADDLAPAHSEAGK
ncbi:hypothetical protein EZH22_11345 [Xanthobacter dioxanivorans]|uniref:Uncharacterized protein n=1 Tax=Xanthobacter dioxanivorans TaxID=2528964 RepID=A0A974SJV0_9HYPH|nr:hypothetical protein [Xanthobacter dioxanivorans]QRG08816.1 hypothetical protein EZH22_11345 [Xanthobacter dioxanivorans]